MWIVNLVVVITGVAFCVSQVVLPYPIEARIVGNSLATFLPGILCPRSCWWIFKHPNLPDHEVVRNQSSNLTLDGRTLDLFRYGDYYYVDTMTNEIFSVAFALYNKSEFICGHCLQVEPCQCDGIHNKTQVLVHFRVNVADGILNLQQCQIIRRRPNGRRYPVRCTINSKAGHCLVTDKVFPTDRFYLTCPMDMELQKDIGLLDVTSESVSMTSHCIDESSIPVTVDIIISDDCFKNFNITWKHNSTSDKPTSYNVTLFQPEGIVDVIHTLNNNYLSANLTPGSEYTITVISCTTSMDCNASSKLSLNFTVESPGSITGLRNTTYNTTFINIAWRYLSDHTQICGKNIYYLINISSYNDTKLVTNNYTTAIQKCTIPNLMSGTAYTITVAATNGEIVGIPNTIVVTTREQQDSPIEDMNDGSAVTVAVSAIVGVLVLILIIMVSCCLYQHKGWRGSCSVLVKCCKGETNNASDNRNDTESVQSVQMAQCSENDNLSLGISSNDLLSDTPIMENSATNILSTNDAATNIPTDIGSDVVSDISTAVPIDVVQYSTISSGDVSLTTQVLQPSDIANLSAHLQLCKGSEAKEAILREHPVVKKYISFSTLTPYLNKYNVFTLGEKHHFNNEHHDLYTRVNNMVDWIQSKSEGDALKFILALNDASEEHSGHKEILRAFKVTVRKGKVYHNHS
ncbi:uncharacterized protein [Dysidea avara]|uniref:uncharacterized protein isoform X3 n=1 Tax=Dysidea avara TaxID=196820 RepID=UPI0033333B9D